jgi:hypothetical protein
MVNFDFGLEKKEFFLLWWKIFYFILVEVKEKTTF